MRLPTLLLAALPDSVERRAIEAAGMRVAREMERLDLDETASGTPRPGG